MFEANSMQRQAIQANHSKKRLEDREGFGAFQQKKGQVKMKIRMEFVKKKRSLNETL